MARTMIYLERFVGVYLRAYMRSRGIGRHGEALGEALLLAMEGPGAFGEERAGVAMADAAGAAAARKVDPDKFVIRANQSKVTLKNGRVERRLRARASTLPPQQGTSFYATLLIRRRIWGHRVPLVECWMGWAGIETWVKVSPKSIPVVHVLKAGEGHLATRGLSEMDQARAMMDLDWLPRLVRLMVLESSLDLQGRSSDLVAVIVPEDGQPVTLPLGGLFAPILDTWEDEAGEGVSTWAVCYEGRRVEETVTITAPREGKRGRRWATRVSRALNREWCNAHNRGATGDELVELDARPTLAAHPLAAIEEE